MSHTAQSVARHGFGFGVLAVATLGFIVASSASRGAADAHVFVTPVVDVATVSMGEGAASVIAGELMAASMPAEFAGHASAIAPTEAPAASVAPPRVRRVRVG